MQNPALAPGSFFLYFYYIELHETR